jgi:hypothetical protein
MLRVMYYSSDKRAVAFPDARLVLTGWAYNNAGHSVSPKPGFEDNMFESDWRGHSLDAPQSSPAGSMDCTGKSCAVPMATRVYRDD